MAAVVIEFLTNVVLSVTGFQLVLLAVVLLVGSPRPSARRNLLVAFLLAKAFLIGRWLLLHFALVDPIQDRAFVLISCSVFLVLAPLLFLHVRAVCEPEFRVRWPMVGHLVPGLIMAAFALGGANIAAGSWTSGSEAADLFVLRYFWSVFWTANLAQIPIYIVAMLRRVHGRRQAQTDRPPTSADGDLGWLLALLSVLSLHWLFVATRASLGFFGVAAPTFISLLDLSSITIFLVFTTALVIRGLGHDQLISRTLDPGRPSMPHLSEREVEFQSERVLAFMAAEKPYLDASIGLEDLADGVALPTWQLSRVINSAFRQNFFGFVNSHRVREAQVKLSDPANNAKTMLQILHESGFNSKSTFNDAFKRHTRLTPSEYRRRAQRAAS